MCVAITENQTKLTENESKKSKKIKKKTKTIHRAAVTVLNDKNKTVFNKVIHWAAVAAFLVLLEEKYGSEKAKKKTNNNNWFRSISRNMDWVIRWCDRVGGDGFELAALPQVQTRACHYPQIFLWTAHLLHNHTALTTSHNISRVCALLVSKIQLSTHIRDTISHVWRAMHSTKSITGQPTKQRRLTFILNGSFVGVYLICIRLFFFFGFDFCF